MGLDPGGADSRVLVFFVGGKRGSGKDNEALELNLDGNLGASRTAADLGNGHGRDHEILGSGKDDETIKLGIDLSIDTAGFEEGSKVLGDALGRMDHGNNLGARWNVGIDGRREASEAGNFRTDLPTETEAGQKLRDGRHLLLMGCVE